jgi:hypothetical protein
MKLSSTQIEDVKTALIEEVKYCSYGERKASFIISLNNELELDLAYKLKVAPVVESGLTLIAELDYCLAFNFMGNEVSLDNKELINTITVKLW